MKTIFILGSSGFAKEVYFLIKEIGGYEVEAFIDVETNGSIAFGKKNIPVISEEVFLSTFLDKKTCLAIGIGDPNLIQKVTKKFKAYDFPNLIHPRAVFDKENVVFGKGNIVTASVIFTTHISIGNFNIFNLSATIGHDTLIGDCNVINPTVNISGGVKIGSNNLLGVSSTILQHKEIGNGSIIGACSLVTKNVDDNLIVFGIPAKIYKK